MGIHKVVDISRGRVVKLTIFMSSEIVLSLLVSTANKSTINPQAKYQLFLDLVTDLWAGEYLE